MKTFENITLCCIDTAFHGGAISALKKSMAQAKFSKVLFITDRDFNIEGIEVIKIPPILSKRDYSKFVIYELYKHFSTDFVWVIQHDGFIRDINQWDDNFLEYDGIGPKWIYEDGRNNFNGGFSIRSKKLQTILGNDPMIQVYDPEDAVIGRLYRRYLEEVHDIKFPPDEVCDRFAYELNEPCNHTVGFHGNFWPPYRKTIVIRRWASLGDVCMCEPILHYYWQKGYRVILDTLPQFYELFRNHYFPVEYYEHFNKKVKHEYLNLDMSYESDPKKLHLKAYYEFAGIPESEQVIRNPRLNVAVDKSTTLFPDKYVCLHIDKRSQEGRNIYGIDWKYVVIYLIARGYKVFQIGKGESEETGAVKMNTLAEPLLMYMLAGAECCIGIDSGPMNIAVALGRKAIVFHGNVNPDYIWPDQKNIRIITNHKPDHNLCSLKYCWHESITVDGQECVDDKLNPPCVQFQTGDLINAINELL